MSRGADRVPREGFGFLRYDRRQFSDFTLRVEYRFTTRQGVDPQGNSGLGIRTGRFDPERSRETRPSYAAFEVQLLDDAGSPPSAHGTGSLYRYKSPTANPARPAPGWNTIEVKWAGPRITVRLNGQTVLEADQSELADVTTRPEGRRLRRTSVAGGTWLCRAIAAALSSGRSRSASNETMQGNDFRPFFRDCR